MQRKLVLIIPLLVILALLALPLLAQETTPEITPSPPLVLLDEGVYTHAETINIGLLLLAGSLSGVLFAFGVMLYRSIPPSLRPILTSILSGAWEIADDELGELVEGTPTEIDDLMYEKLKAYIDKRLDEKNLITK